MVYQIAIRIFEYYGTSLRFLKTQYSGEIEKRKEKQTHRLKLGYFHNMYTKHTFQKFDLRYQIP